MPPNGIELGEGRGPSRVPSRHKYLLSPRQMLLPVFGACSWPNMPTSPLAYCLKQDRKRRGTFPSLGHQARYRGCDECGDPTWSHLGDAVLRRPQERWKWGGLCVSPSPPNWAADARIMGSANARTGKCPLRRRAGKARQPMAEGSFLKVVKEKKKPWLSAQVKQREKAS